MRAYWILLGQMQHILPTQHLLGRVWQSSCSYMYIGVFYCTFSCSMLYIINHDMYVCESDTCRTICTCRCRTIFTLHTILCIHNTICAVYLAHTYIIYSLCFQYLPIFECIRSCFLSLCHSQLPACKLCVFDLPGPTQLRLLNAAYSMFIAIFIQLRCLIYHVLS